MKSISVKELRFRMEHDDEMSINCFRIGDMPDVDCGDCPFNTRKDCGGHSYDINWDALYEHLKTRGDDERFTILDAAPFLTNKVVTISDYEN
jgi:hypothetical protein